VRVTGLDLLTLDIHASLLARLDEAGEAAVGEGAEDEADDEAAAEAAGGLALAIDLADADAPEAGATPA
jgi:exoribonuclease-2